MLVPDAATALDREMEAAKVLLANLSDIVAGDDALAADMVEGETSLLEAIQRCIDLVCQDETHAKAIADYRKRLADREARLEKRAELMRSAIAVAMEIARQQKLITPLGTVSVRKTPGKLEIVEESEIPAKYFVQPEPTLSKKAILEDIKGGAEVPGCRLSEPGTTIAIRV
jgi:hypothetical protein